jgi:L-lysine 6-transaminase
VPDNCFRLSGRISSTWGGNLTDMARAAHLLGVVEQERLLENAKAVGALLLEGLCKLAAEHPQITAARGRGLLVAFDLPTSEQRDHFYAGLFELGLLVLKCGPRSIRFRPALDVTAADALEAIDLMRQQCGRRKPND